MSTRTEVSGQGVPGSAHTIGERLQWAIQHLPRRGRQRGLRLFQRLMEERAEEIEREGGPPLVGTYLSSVQGYVRGEVEPSMQFLVEAARVLGVREAWLIVGDGPPTDEEERWAIEAGARLAAGLRSLFDAMRSYAEREIASTFAGYHYLPHSARAALWRTFKDYADRAIDRDRALKEEIPQVEGWAMLGERFGRYLNGAVELLELDPMTVEPVEWALMVDSLLRPIVVACEVERHEGRNLVEEEANDE